MQALAGSLNALAGEASRRRHRRRLLASSAGGTAKEAEAEAAGGRDREATRELLVDALSSMAGAANSSGQLGADSSAAMSSSLSAVTSTPAEVTPAGTDKALSLAALLVGGAQQPEAAGSLAASLGNLLQSAKAAHAGAHAAINASGTAGRRRMQQAAAQGEAARRGAQVRAVVQRMGVAAVATRVVGEPAVALAVPQFAMQAAKSSAAALEGQFVGGAACANRSGADDPRCSVRVPSGAFNGSGAEVSAHVVKWASGSSPYFYASPYPNNASDGGGGEGGGNASAAPPARPKLESQVVSVTFAGEGGEELPLRNLSEPFVVTLPILPGAGGDWLEGACADRHVDCAGLTQAKGCAYDLTAHGYVNESVATVCPRSCDSCPTLAHDGVPSCSFYDTRAEAWRTDGVVLSRSNTSVRCAFTHLTDFGAMFAPPKFSFPSFSGSGFGAALFRNIVGAIFALCLLTVFVFTCVTGIKSVVKVMREKPPAFYEPHAITSTPYAVAVRGPSSPFAFCIFRTRITIWYPDRVETDPYFIPGVPHVVAQATSRARTWTRSAASPSRRCWSTRCAPTWAPEFWGQKMGSEGSRLAESEQGVWFWLKRYSTAHPILKKERAHSFPGGGKRFCPQILEPRHQRADVRHLLHRGGRPVLAHAAPHGAAGSDVAEHDLQHDILRHGGPPRVPLLLQQHALGHHQQRELRRLRVTWLRARICGIRGVREYNTRLEQIKYTFYVLKYVYYLYLFLTIIKTPGTAHAEALSPITKAGRGEYFFY